ncbi:MAG: pantoate--beta-alanine ligase [Planctomycetes bacterium]|nr:pantoate--beta-alanine ligase [Planctomycetota bacterium]
MTRVIREIREVREYVEMLKRNRFSLGFVPTMGALHDGHCSLMRQSFRENDRTAVSIYVNPLQFLPGEDFEKYPRQFECDLARCEEEKVDIVFAPTVAAMQPLGRSTVVKVEGVSHEYEGRVRPGHFDGVATVVSSLFNVVQPTRAYFGQKDYQQTVVLRRMVRDLHVPVDLVICPIVRDPDGLAMSSRNVYLSADDRAEALRLARAIVAGERAVQSGETSGDRLRAILRDAMSSPRADVTIDYADVVHPDTLVPIQSIESRAVLIAVLRVGRVRLLDNAIVAAPGAPSGGA